MSMLFLIVKVFIVLFFLIMFLRSDKLVWGIGLITVTTAILLDAFLSTFGEGEMLEELGFFFYIIAGALFAGGAIWLWTFLRPKISEATSTPASQSLKNAPGVERSPQGYPNKENIDTAFDRQMLFDQIRYRLSPDDLLDLIFDLGWAENDVLVYQQDTNQLIVRIIDLAEERGQSGDLALAVERILTPIPAENLPRAEKLSDSSPQTVLRHYLLANYSLENLQQIAADLDVDWEIIAGDNKKTKVRNLLQYLYRRNRVPELIAWLKSEPVTQPE